MPVIRYYPLVNVLGEGKAGQLQLPDGLVVRWFVSGGTARVVSASWHPEFGFSIPSKRIEVLFNGPEASLEFTWN